MKKIYLLMSAVLVTAAAFAQSVRPVGTLKTIPMPAAAHSADRTGSDTTGIGINGMLNYQPAFAPSGQLYTSALTYGYIYGVAPSSQAGVKYDKCAQGYLNNNSDAIQIDGVLLWFVAKQSDLTTSATSKVVVKAWAMAANKAYDANTDGSFNQTTLNAQGPATSVASPVASANLLFSDIDTTIGENYVPFTSPPYFTGDFAIGIDAASLAAGDTVGLAMDAPGDAGTLHYAFHNVVNKWFVSNQLYTSGGVGIDNDIAMFAVYSASTGVNEFYNGMKLAVYPNPSASASTIEYTLENSSSNVSLTVYDAVGHVVLENKYPQQSAGKYSVNIETANLTAGTYFYQLRANGSNFTKKLMVTK